MADGTGKYQLARSSSGISLCFHCYSLETPEGVFLGRYCNAVSPTLSRPRPDRTIMTRSDRPEGVPSVSNLPSCSSWIVWHSEVVCDDPQDILVGGHAFIVAQRFRSRTR